MASEQGALATLDDGTIVVAGTTIPVARLLLARIEHGDDAPALAARFPGLTTDTAAAALAAYVNDPVEIDRQLEELWRGLEDERIKSGQSITARRLRPPS